jgi:hypothetical protein
MVNSSLLQLLKKFDKQQLKEFNSFVKSPFFNSNKALISLYEYIRKQYPEFEPAKLEKQFINRKIFGKTEFNDGFFRVLMSNLQDLAEEYLSYKGVQKDPLIKKRYLLSELTELGENKLAEKILKEELKSVSKAEPRTPDDYWGLYNIAFYRKYFYSTKFSVSKENKPNSSMYEEQKYLIYHFLLRLLADHFYHLNQVQLINYEPKLYFLDETILFLESHKEFLESPILNITYLRVLLLKNNKPEDLNRLKKTFYEIYSKLGKKDNFNTISIILNFCYRQYYLTDDINMLRERLEILKFGLDNGIDSFEDNGFFDTSRFNNICSTGLELGETGWVQQFIENYSSKVNPEKSNVIVNLAKAMLSYYTGDNESAIQYLSNIKKTETSTDKFSVKVLQMRIYFDMGLFEQAAAAADTFRHVLQNDSLLSSFHKELYRNFYSFYYKLLNAKLKPGKTSREEMTGVLTITKKVIHKNWLKKKIEELP